MQARAGAAARLEVVAKGSNAAVGGSTPFGQVTDYASVPSGTVKLELRTGAGSSQSTAETATLAAGGRYTVVSVAKGRGYQLAVYRDGGARPGRARLRVIHAAPELGSPDIELGRHVIAQKLAFHASTGYVSVSPGSYELSVMGPRSKSKIVWRRVALTAGTTQTAVLAGSAGARARVILTSDMTSAPAAAPKTGLGGLAKSGGAGWLLVLLAAASAGALGGAAQIARARRARR